MLIPTHSILAGFLFLSVGASGGSHDPATAVNNTPMQTVRQTQTNKQNITADPEVVFTFPQNFDPPGDGRPEKTRGSGSRTGSCSIAAAADTVTADTDSEEVNSNRIRAVMPADNFGLTFQSHPSVFINFDGDVAPAVMIRFEDETGTYDERARLPVESDRSVQGFALPSDRPPLAVGKNYKWTILVACDGQVNPYHPIFSGWVQRVALTEAVAVLGEQPIEEQIPEYTNGGYWYDAVLALNQALQDSPTDKTVRSLWTQLLEFSDSL